MKVWKPLPTQAGKRWQILIMEYVIQKLLSHDVILRFKLTEWQLVREAIGGCWYTFIFPLHQNEWRKCEDDSEVYRAYNTEKISPYQPIAFILIEDYRNEDLIQKTIREIEETKCM